ncbi:hypothetical protein, partial [Massilia orientalis]
MAALQAAFLNADSGELFIHHALGHHPTIGGIWLKPERTCFEKRRQPSGGTSMERLTCSASPTSVTRMIRVALRRIPIIFTTQACEVFQMFALLHAGGYRSANVAVGRTPAAKPRAFNQLERRYLDVAPMPRLATLSTRPNG